MEVETSLPPERVRAALLDFSDRRPDIWPGLTRSLYKAHSVGETTADIQEGTKTPFGKVWATERYDWSDPNTVRWTVQESNFSTVGSYVAATLEPRGDGGTRVHIEWSRSGTTLLGKFLVRLIVMSKGKPIVSSVQQAFKKMEAEPAS